MPPKCTLRFERALYREGATRVAGIDEAGRGPLAGPVVAAAVILPGKFSLPGLTDSKRLTPPVRETFFQQLTANPLVEYGIGIASVTEIDRFNILRASYLAMERAVAELRAAPEHLLIDGLPVPNFSLPQTAIVGGDARSLSIAAASVIAKVTRDLMMQNWHEEFPVYQFRENKGYGTPEHLESLRLHGPCPIHRRTLLRSRRLISRLRKRLRRLSPRPRLAPHLRLGKQGERAAERFLKKQSFKILYRNFRARNGGEIDLVCRDRKDQVLVFAEVKTRRQEIYAPPRDAVGLRKQRQIIKAAKEWLRLLDHPGIPFRFDIVEVVTEPELQIRHIRAAFQMDELYDDDH